MNEDKNTFYWVVAIIVAVIAGVIYFSNKNSNSTVQTTPPITPSDSASTTVATNAESSDLDSNGCFTSKNVRDHEGENGCVDFHVSYTYESSKGNKFIDEFQDYSSGFSIYIPVSSSASNVDLNQFNDKDIKVTGEISNYQGGPQVIVTNLSQIKIYQ